MNLEPSVGNLGIKVLLVIYLGKDDLESFIALLILFVAKMSYELEFLFGWEVIKGDLFGILGRDLEKFVIS